MNIKRVELTSKAHPYANERLTCKREYAFFAAYHREVKAILKSQGLDKVSTPTTFAALAQKFSIGQMLIKNRIKVK
jgi:hypothetical protein